jgi:hypothetical protein
MATDIKTNPPSSTVGDAAHMMARAGLSAIPMIGGPGAELFSYLIVPPLTKRRDEWVQSIAEGLQALEKRVDGFTIESLVGNEAFVTIVMNASQLAIRNHRKEKLEALRNAVLNAALNPPDEDFQAILLNFIDAATPWHLRVLGFYHDPESHLQERGIKLTTGDYLGGYVSQAFPELERQDAFRLQIERDLLHYGLIYPEGAWYSRRTTDTGERVLALITSPLQDSHVGGGHNRDLGASERQGNDRS